MAKKYNYEELEKAGLTDVHVDGEVMKNLETDKEFDSNYNFRIKNPIPNTVIAKQVQAIFRPPTNSF